jgi:hypothetical protein
MESVSAPQFSEEPGRRWNGAIDIAILLFSMPISDRETRDETSTDALVNAVRQSSRRLWIAANALCAVERSEAGWSQCWSDAFSTGSVGGVASAT